MHLQVKRLAPHSKLPTRATEHSAGLDLYAVDETRISSGASVEVPTGIAASIPHGCVGKLYIRSGHARKYDLELSNSVGILDSDYRGPIIAIVRNKGRNPYTIKAGERFAQLVIEEYVHADVVEVTELPDTERGTNGLGSTGK